MTTPSVATDVHQPFDVHVHLTTQITFNQVIAFDGFSELNNVRIFKIFNPNVR